MTILRLIFKNFYAHNVRSLVYSHHQKSRVKITLLKSGLREQAAIKYCEYCSYMNSTSRPDQEGQCVLKTLNASCSVEGSHKLL